MAAAPFSFAVLFCCVLFVYVPLVSGACAGVYPPFVPLPSTTVCDVFCCFCLFCLFVCVSFLIGICQRVVGFLEILVVVFVMRSMI